MDSIRSANSEIENEVILYSSQFEKINENLKQGLLNQLEANRELLQIDKSLLSLLNGFENIEDSNEAHNIKILEEKEVDFSISISDIKLSISQHLKLIDNWSKSIRFRDMSDGKSLSKTYIDLDFHLIPNYINLNENNERYKTNIVDLVKKSSQHIVILGQPGAGKTTTLKKLVHSFVYSDTNLKYNFPVLIRLRNINNNSISPNGENIIINNILQILGIDLNITVDSSSIKEGEIILDRINNETEIKNTFYNLILPDLKRESILKNYHQNMIRSG